jgi:Ala-tRNA(Pro) deacylase
MSIAPTLARYLDQHANYDMMVHEPTPSSTRTAEMCHIPGDRLAKGVVLRWGDGYLLAVIPASHHIELPELQKQLGDPIALASENEIGELFRDCVRGAIPPIGDCSGLDVVVDDSIGDQPDIYMEGGDHETLIHMDRAQFAALTADAPHGRFSTRG